MAEITVPCTPDQITSALTTRELQVAKALCLGWKNRAIADELGISVKTIDSHRINIKRKLFVVNNVELARLFWRAGIVQA